MEQINNLELRDENSYPDESILKKVLGKSYSSYVNLLDLFTRNDMTCEWRYYRDGKAWLCKVQKKKKTVIWMSAWKGFMKATIYFPDRCTNDLCDLKIRKEIKNRIKTVKRVGQSVPCMFEIRNDDELKDLETVMKYKMALK